MKKVLVLPLLGALFACGGGGLGGTSGDGGSVSGFYSLSVSLDQRDITSPSVSGTLPNITVPTDTISGSVSLTYSGNSPNPLRGVIQRAQLCLDGLSCYSLPVSGVLTANANPLSFSLSLNAYKFGLPWIAINPYEDRVLSTDWEVVPLSSSSTTITYALPLPFIVGPYIYQISGRVVEVYQGTTLLCNNQGTSGECSVSVNNNVVSINFPGGVLPNLFLRYSQDTKVDINPSVDASVYGGTYGGSSTATVNGYVEVQIRLESGETLRARANITLRVVAFP